MKIFTVILTLVVSAILHATIITVDNKTPSVGDYTTIQAAHDAASSGDTIFVYPSNVPYSGASVTQKLHLIGTGIDDPTESIKKSFIDGVIAFQPGSDGSVIEGIISFSYISVNVDNITIKRNKLVRMLFSPGIQGTIIIQNYFSNSIDADILPFQSSCESFIANNVFIQEASTKIIEATVPSISLTLLNNIFDASTTAMWIADGAYLANNIIVSGSVQSYGTPGAEFYNNMCNATQLPNKNGNILSVDMSTVFVDYQNYDFHLLPGSPAIGTGQNGTDMGIYGGSLPFIDGGFPGLPSIIDLQADHVVVQSQGMDVIIKAKSNKE